MINPEPEGLRLVRYSHVFDLIQFDSMTSFHVGLATHSGWADAAHSAPQLWLYSLSRCASSRTSCLGSLTGVDSICITSSIGSPLSTEKSLIGHDDQFHLVSKVKFEVEIKDKSVVVEDQLEAMITFRIVSSPS